MLPRLIESRLALDQIARAQQLVEARVAKTVANAAVSQDGIEPAHSQTRPVARRGIHPCSGHRLAQTECFGDLHHAPWGVRAGAAELVVEWELLVDLIGTRVVERRRLYARKAM